LGWVGRILGGFLALALLAAGGFGLLTGFLGGRPLAKTARSALRDALAAASVSDVRAIAAAAETRLAAPLLRYSLAPAGLLLLLFSMRTGGGRLPSEAEVEVAVSGRPTLDKRLVKKSLKQAHALAKKGEVVEAAELLFSCEEFEKAAEYFVQAGDFVRAAEIRHDQNRFVECGELYAQAGDYDSAAGIFAQQNEFRRAADAYLKAGSKGTAAEMFEKAGEFRLAGDCYREAEFERYAAGCYVKCKAWQLAAECLEAVYTDEVRRAGGGQDPAKHAELTKLVRQAGQLWMRAESPERALGILERGNCPLDAAQVANLLGEYGRAAELFKDAGDLLKAAEALEQFGESGEAARLLGEYYRERGDYPEAATQLEKAGEFTAAGDLYRQTEDYLNAGECYAKQAEHEQAAEMFRMAGERERAADSYELAGRFTEAAECCALSGLGEREADLLEKAGELLRAGEAYHRDGLDDNAIKVLQQVLPGDEGFARASALIADLFRARGQVSLAIKALDQAIGGEVCARETLPMFYELATLHEENGGAEKAVEIYEKIMALDYHHKDVGERLVRLRDKLPSAEMRASDNTATTTLGEHSQPGRYEVVSELGRGGMGIVYKAKDTLLDRLVAFKVLPDSFKENPQALKNFLREAKAAAKLNHPNIVTVYDTGEQDGRYYIAMEFVDGTTLKEILRRRGPISPTGVFHVTMQISEALAYAHEKKVVHRDIKTANTMWTRDKKAKIMDFGLAKVVEEARSHTTVVSGTPYYMSPEQTLGKNVDHRTDIYSLGVTLFELLTGTVPFKEGNIPYHHVHSPPPDVRSLRSDCPDSLAQIVNRCLEKDAAARYQSAGEIVDEVRATLVASS
jgi:tetratricopeptide (TPR) repeat protein